jgi:hypothetical protein
VCVCVWAFWLAVGMVCICCTWRSPLALHFLPNHVNINSFQPKFLYWNPAVWSWQIFQKFCKLEMYMFKTFVSTFRTRLVPSRHHVSLPEPCIRLSSSSCVLHVLPARTFRNVIPFYGEELSAPRPTPKLEDHPLSAVRDCLFDIFAATLHTAGRSSIRNLRTRRAVVTGTDLARL